MSIMSISCTLSRKTQGSWKLMQMVISYKELEIHSKQGYERLSIKRK